MFNGRARARWLQLGHRSAVLRAKLIACLYLRWSACRPEELNPGESADDPTRAGAKSSRGQNEIRIFRDNGCRSGAAAH